MDAAIAQQLDAEDLHETPRLENLKPLNPARREIRLIQLLDNDIRIQTHSLDDRPMYHSLSYYWGPSLPTRHVRIQGEQVPIRKTVADLFDCLRQSYSRDSLFWIDMLCINQHKLSERNSQVTLMSSIYANAVDVISWLGRADALTKSAFKLVRDNIRYQDPDTTTFDANTSQSKQVPIDQAFIETEILPAFRAIARRRYWSRVWIAQETILARDCWLLCGTDHLNLTDLYELGLPWMVQSQPSASKDDRISKYTKFEDPKLQDAMNGWATIRNIHMYRQRLHNEEALDIREILETFARNDCANPLDKVFGLRALNKELSAIEVDYSRSPMEVYLSVLHQGLLHLDKGKAFQTLPRFLFDLGMSESAQLPRLISEARNAHIPIPIEGQVIGELASAKETPDNCLTSTGKADTIGICIKVTPRTRDQPFRDINTDSPLSQYVCGHTYEPQPKQSLLSKLQPKDLIVHVEGFYPIILFLRPVTQSPSSSIPTTYKALGNFRETDIFSPTDPEYDKSTIHSRFAINEEFRQGEIVYIPCPSRPEFQPEQRYPLSKYETSSNLQTPQTPETDSFHWRPQIDYEQTKQRFNIECTSLQGLLLWPRQERINYIL